MKSIYKYTLDQKESNVLELPINTEILSVESQEDKVVVYGLVDTKESGTVDYDFRIYGTGFDIDTDLAKYKFLGTVNLYDGRLMFHIFYKQV